MMLNLGASNLGPRPARINPLRKDIMTVADIEPEALLHARLIRYDPGAGIAWRRDWPVFEHVVCITPGHEAVELRRRSGTRFERCQMARAPRW